MRKTPAGPDDMSIRQSFNVGKSETEQTLHSKLPEEGFQETVCGWLGKVSGLRKRLLPTDGPDPTGSKEQGKMLLGSTLWCLMS